MLAPSGKATSDMYAMLNETVENFALVSFTGTYEALPLWAYYASNFGGMCLEFNSSKLMVGDFQNEKLRPVTYAQTALPPISIADLVSEGREESIISRITRKRTEWAHEREWRIVTGEVGPKHYLDEALQRVFLGPRMKPDHANEICEVLKKRPVEVLQGEVRGFELTFRKVQDATPFAECDCVGAGRFKPDEAFYSEKDLRSFLSISIEKLIDECAGIAQRPNAEEVFAVDVSTRDAKTIYVQTTHKLRNGREVNERLYFDKRLKPIQIAG